MVRLSIILPCYNVEKYIAECLDSLYAQDIPETEYEVICVNDCSPDGTRAIIVEYQKLHRNLILIDHEVNKRQGGARNTGLMAAKGEYVWFVDPDDYICANTLNGIINLLIDKNLDILFFDYQKFDVLNNVISTPKVNFPKEISEGDVIFNESNFWDVTSLSWARVCNKSYLIKENLYFYNDFYMEDVAYGIRCFLTASRVLYYPSICYYYRATPDSVMNSPMSGIKLASYFKLAIEYYQLHLEVNDNSLKQKFLDISLFYFKSIEKPLLYLSFNDRKTFHLLIDKIDNKGNILKATTASKVLSLYLKSTFIQYTLFLTSPILNSIKKYKNRQGK